MAAALILLLMANEWLTMSWLLAFVRFVELARPLKTSDRAILARDPTENARTRDAIFACCSLDMVSKRILRLLCSNRLPTEYARTGRSLYKLKNKKKKMKLSVLLLHLIKTDFEPSVFLLTSFRHHQG